LIPIRVTPTPRQLVTTLTPHCVFIIEAHPRERSTVLPRVKIRHMYIDPASPKRAKPCERERLDQSGAPRRPGIDPGRSLRFLASAALAWLHRAFFRTCLSSTASRSATAFSTSKYLDWPARFCAARIPQRWKFSKSPYLTFSSYDDARPHPPKELAFRDEPAVGFQKDREDIYGARAELDGDAVGGQLPPAQQNT
jgi:hypothetical protein